MKLLIKRILLVLLTAAALASISGCATTKAPGLSSPYAALRGMVYNENRQPVQDVDVNYLHEGAAVKTTRSDIHGRYIIPEVPCGQVTLQFTKKGYEPLVWNFSFEGPTQVAYVKITNLNELLDDAADDIQKRDWAAATSSLARIQRIEPGNIVAAYLVAEMTSRQGNPTKAAEMLEKLSTGNNPSFAIELTLADLYQDDLNQPEKALAHLRKALTIQDDVDIETRIAGLEKNYQP